MTNLIGGSRPTESLVVHQLGHTGLLSAHRTAGLLGPQLDGPESGVLSVKHHQLLAAGSWSAGSRKEETMALADTRGLPLSTQASFTRYRVGTLSEQSATMSYMKSAKSRHHQERSHAYAFPPTERLKCRCDGWRRVLAREDYVSEPVPFNCAGSRQGLGLALGLLPVKHLSVQVTELHLVIVQQAQAPCRDQAVRQEVFRTDVNPTQVGQRFTCLCSISYNKEHFML
ncbi:hypothetical protein EYF80_006668 [Liparis tanakae]|uniref:Uncharacterized protein n=1 Tax=Liparis tanakae TaxID=230148 RepID=A0A4Z2IZ50_9TELE|nr:hypothetical protein EYF80_006668 [Liparis tanakae]